MYSNTYYIYIKHIYNKSESFRVILCHFTIKNINHKSVFHLYRNQNKKVYAFVPKIQILNI